MAFNSEFNVEAYSLLNQCHWTSIRTHQHQIQILIHSGPCSWNISPKVLVHDSYLEVINEAHSYLESLIQS